VVVVVVVVAEIRESRHPYRSYYYKKMPGYPFGSDHARSFLDGTSSFRRTYVFHVPYSSTWLSTTNPFQKGVCPGIEFEFE
jgi:hypothetical protein